MASGKKLYATLIGINAYKQNALNGCVKDVLALDRLLREQCLQQSGALTYDPYFLLAPNEQDLEQIQEYQASINQPLEFESPTFSNVSQKAFAHLKGAQDGDICLFYFSGHGSQTDAPEVFWHSKPDRKNETLVCVDSRDSDAEEARDLIDKEIAFLLWDALKGKTVHALVIVDSCHSGNITRAMADGKTAATYRFLQSDKNQIPFSSYLGSDNTEFYELKQGNAFFKIARYVHLAAAQNYQKAQETADGGLFTSKLVALLRTGGSSQSYQDLIRNLSVNVRLRNPQQNPVAFATIEDDLRKQFLGDGIVPYEPSFEVRYNTETSQWILYGGAQHGITAPAGSIKSTVRLVGDSWPSFKNVISINEVSGDFSILEAADMLSIDKSGSDYKAVVTSLSSTPVIVGFSLSLLAKQQLVASLETAFSKSKFLFFKFPNPENSAVDYLIDITEKGLFILIRPDSATPIFKREKDAGTFLRNVEQLGKWLGTVEMSNTNTRFGKSDFIFTIQRIEGKSFSGIDRELLEAEKWFAEPGSGTVFSYANDQQPAFRFSIAIAPESDLQSCFVSALYLDSLFGIETGLVRSDSGKLEKNGSPLHLGFLNGENEIKTIKLNINPGYAAYNINEITDYLKIFVSEKPLDLSRYKQSSLELDIRGNKGIDNDLFGEKATSHGTDWTVFDFPFRIVGPYKEKDLVPGVSVRFSGFSIDVPSGFTAKAFAATQDDVLRRQRISKSGDRNIALTGSNVVQPVALWGENITESAFPAGLASGDVGTMEVLELTSVDGKPLSLQPGKPLIIKPTVQSDKVRAADDPDEVIIPCGFDEVSQLWYPVGSSHANGNVYVDFLPAETSGIIQQNGPPTKSLGGSVKLFFRKLFRKKKQLNTLVLYVLTPEGQWNELTREPAKMKDQLQKEPFARVVLLTHGLTGDTRHMVAALKEIMELKDTVRYVLTYDYENLATPIEDAAKALGMALESAGFGSANTPRLTIIAHSQGGLLSRWLVEQRGGERYIEQLILVGVASSGSELAKLGSSVLSLLTHALNVTGPIQWAISGLSLVLKALRSDPGRTLKDTNPGSPFIDKLALSRKPDHVIYNIIIGDLSLIDRRLDTDDKFLERLRKVLAENLVVPWFTQGLYAGQPNDIAVTISSATAINGYNHPADTRIVASNHLAYFRKSLAQNELLEFLKAGSA